MRGTNDDVAGEFDLRGLIEETTIGAFFIFGGGALSTMLSAICGILVARLLGPELYGAYSLSFTVVGFISIFTGLGINLALTRFTAFHDARGEYSKVRKTIKAGLLFTVVEALLVLLVGYVFLEHLTLIIVNRPELAGPTLYLLPMILFQALFYSATGVLIGLGDAKRVAYSNIYLQLARLVFSPLLIILGYGLVGSLIGSTVAYGIGGLFSTMYAYIHYRRLAQDNNDGEVVLDYISKMLRYGLPLYISSTMMLFMDTLRNSILSYIADDFVVGNFNVALRFTIILSIFMAPISTALFPAFTKIGENNRDLNRFFKVALKYSTLFIIPVTMLTITMSREIIYLFFGRRYVLAPYYFSLIALSYLYVGLGYMILPSLFGGIGKPRYNFYMSLIYSIVFTISSISLVYLAGLMENGLLYSMLLANGLSTLYGLVVLKRRYEITIEYSEIAGIYLASSLASLLIYSISSILGGEGVVLYIMRLFVGIFVFVFAYVTFLPIFKAINKDDIDALISILSRIRPFKPLVSLLARYQLAVIKAIWS